jgi:outer membrane protein
MAPIEGHSMNTRLLPLALASLLLACGATAHAQSAGTRLVKVGVNRISPDVESGNLSAPSVPGTKIDVNGANSVIFTAAYMLTNTWSLEFYAGLPYEHEVVGDGAINGVGKLGTVKQISPTLFAQYRFEEFGGVLRPYLGLGLTYAYFYGEKGSGTLTAMTNAGGAPTRLSASPGFGPSAQAGATLKLSPQWFLDIGVVKTYVKSKTTLSTGQTIDAKLNPVSSNLSLGYRF